LVEIEMLRGYEYLLVGKFNRISIEERLEIGIGPDGFRAVGGRRFQAPT
jgi:hypothetical protein